MSLWLCIFYFDVSGVCIQPLLSLGIILGGVLPAMLATVQTHRDILTLIATLLAGVGTVGTFAIAWWLGYKSPQALQAKIEKGKYLRSEREKHYKQLNEDIFQKLSERIIIISDSFANEKERQRLSIKFSSVISDLDIQSALNHLNTDYPGFANDFSDFKKEVKEYNKNLDELIQNVGERVVKHFQSFMEVAENYSSSQEFGVISIFPTSEVILKILSQIPKGIAPSDKEIVLKFCHRTIKRKDDASLDYKEKTSFQVLGYSIANLPVSFPPIGPEEVSQEGIDAQVELDTVKKSIYVQICEISSDEELISTYRALMSKRDNLIQKDVGFREKISSISKKISKGRYKTIASCCEDEIFLKG